MVNDFWIMELSEVIPHKYYKTWDECRYSMRPMTEEWTSRLWSIYTISVCVKLLKGRQFWHRLQRGWTPEGIMLSDVSQTREEQMTTESAIQGLEQSVSIDTESRTVSARRCGGECDWGLSGTVSFCKIEVATEQRQQCTQAARAAFTPAETMSNQDARGGRMNREVIYV